MCIRDRYNIDVTKLEEALSDKTKAVMIAHTLGNPFDLSAVKAFCDKHNLWLVEDNCDALGTQYTIDGVTKFTGTWGDIGTSSIYPVSYTHLDVYKRQAPVSALKIAVPVTGSSLNNVFISASVRLRESVSNAISI